MAHEKQFEGSRVTRKGPYPQISALLSKMVAGGKQCASRSTITPTKTCSANLYRCIKRRVGRSLRGTHCKGTLLDPSRKQVAHQLSGTEGGLSGYKRVPRPLLENIVLIATDNTTVVLTDLEFQETSNSQSLTHSRLA